MNEFSDKYFAGTSGLMLPVPNKSLYPEEFQSKSRLCYYASLFNSIEINSSFYKVPMAATVRKWAEDVPAGFRFTFKLWREITHVKGLDFRADDVRRFMEVIDGAGVHKGCLLVQFPPKLDQQSLPKLDELLSVIRECDPDSTWQTFVELRNDSWYNEGLHEMLNAYNSDIVRHDKKGAPGFMDPETDAVYLRFHGPGGNYRGSYTEEFLYEYAQYAIDWMLEGKTVYIYFNNTMGEAIGNLNSISRFIRDGLEQ